MSSRPGLGRLIGIRYCKQRHRIWAELSIPPSVLYSIHGNAVSSHVSAFLEAQHTRFQPATKMSGSQPPFDPLSFNPRDLPKELLVEWSRDPSMFLDKPGHPTQYDAKNRVEYVKRMVAVYVSPAVFALGKDPYPGLRENRYIPELRTTTPIYRDTRPWMGSNYLLMHIS